MKPANTPRRALFALMLASATALSSTGCSSSGVSVASLNPFSKAKPTLGAGGADPKLQQSIAAGNSGVTDGFNSAGATTKGFFGKTTAAVAGMFGRGKSTPQQLAEQSDSLRLDKRPDSVDPEVFVANGQLWESTGDMDKAMESYLKALGSDPNHAPALTNAARLNFRQGKLPQAVDYFQKALVQKPDDAGLHNDLGLTLSKLGRQTEAVASLEKSLQLAPGTSRYANNLASVKFEGGDAGGAMAVLTQNNKPAVAHFNMAYLHFKKGQNGLAETHLGQALKYEAQANADPATGRAIVRSREMLAMIKGEVPAGGQRAPEIKRPGTSGPAYAFGVPPKAGNTGSIHQVSQPAGNGNIVAKAASMAPAMSAIRRQQPSQTPAPPTETVAQTVSVPPPMAASSPVEAGQAVARTASTATTSKWNSWNVAKSDTKKVESKPAPPTPSNPTTSAPSTSAPTIGPEDSAGGFTLPEGFTLP